MRPKENIPHKIFENPTEKHLDKNTKLCYTYDERSRVTQRTKVNYNTGETTDETFTYDAAGNIITTADNCDTDSFSYDTNNRLTYHNGMSVTYDADGNMTSAYHDGSRDSFRYDSTNRLIGTNTNAYTYNAENVRIRNLCGDSETTYVYNTNAKLSSMLMKTTDGVVTKYVYGRGLIGEETNGSFKVYHFDYRGSTVAITDINGNVTDRFEYDTYGELTSRTGSSDVIFLYNGRDGVVTDTNGLIYMRARYYSPELRRFVNADILAGDITNAVTLNRYAYANANPVSMIDPKGREAGRGDGGGSLTYNNSYTNKNINFPTVRWNFDTLQADFDDLTTFDVASEFLINDDMLAFIHDGLIDSIESSARPKGMSAREWKAIVKESKNMVDDLYGKSSKLANGLKAAPYVAIAIDVIAGGCENLKNGEDWKETLSDAAIDLGIGLGTTLVSTVVSSAVAGAVAGSVAPGVGNLIGMAAGTLVGIGIYIATEVVEVNGTSFVEWLDGLM